MLCFDTDIGGAVCRALDNDSSTSLYQVRVNWSLMSRQVD